MLHDPQTDGRTKRFPVAQLKYNLSQSAVGETRRESTADAMFLESLDERVFHLPQLLGFRRIGSAGTVGSVNWNENAGRTDPDLRAAQFALLRHRTR